MAILAQLELNEATEMDFEIEIHGTTESSSEIRFIIEGPQYGIICKCTESNGVISATIPKLKGILPAGTFDAKLEVVVDGKFFQPLRESIEFKPMVEFDITSTKAKPAQALKVETKNVKVRVIEDAKEESPDEEENIETTEKVKEEPAVARAKNKPAAATTPVKPQPAPAKKQEKVEPTVTWNEILKQSITDPANAPKAEAEPHYQKASTPAPAAPTKDSNETGPAKKTLDPTKAQALLGKLSALKKQLADAKAKKQ